MTINSSTFDAAGDTDFLNTGTVILGNDATDVLTFAGGLATTGNDSNPGTLNVAGTINTTNTRMDIGAVTLTKATTFDTGNHADGVLNIGAVTSRNEQLDPGFRCYSWRDHELDLNGRCFWRVDDP